MIKKCELTKTNIDMNTMIRLEDGSTISHTVYADLCYETGKGSFTIKEAQKEYAFQQKFYKATKDFLGMVKRYSMHYLIPEDLALDRFLASERRHAEEMFKKDVSCLTKEEALVTQNVLKNEFITDEIRSVRIGKEGGKTSLENFDTYWGMHDFQKNTFASA